MCQFNKEVCIPVGGFNPQEIATVVRDTLYIYSLLTVNLSLNNQGTNSVQSCFLDNGILADKLWYIHDWLAPEGDAVEVWGWLQPLQKENLMAAFLQQLSKLFDIFCHWQQAHP